ncbi:MAG: 16S rRNA (adenine(1518)-N(6)/adenine(1519)-N(6))-dimethyltransferase RsmA [Gemmatimonadales bacterium]
MGRRLGQHFLTDPGILDRIVEAIHPGVADTVIEVGPGRGSLTTRLAERVGHVIAIERDRVLAQRLTSVDLKHNVKVVQGDALKIEWTQLAPGESDLTSFKVVGNIPYYITAPLIEKALSPPAPDVVVYLVQEEVADRICAEPGSRRYGALTVGIQVVAMVEKLFRVKAGSFRPPPKIDSAVVRFVPRLNPLVDWAELAGFRRFMAQIFSRRRKQILGVLSAVSSRSRSEMTSILDDLSLRPSDRPEVVPPESFVELFHILSR